MSGSQPRFQDPNRPAHAVDVDQLRALFRTTGALHEVQVFNLKVWPRLCFPQAKNIKTSVAVEAREVTFELTVPWYKRVPDVRERAMGLHQSVQHLLGADFQTTVLSGGKVIFVGERVMPVQPTEQYAGTDFEAGRIVPPTPWKFPKNS